MLGLAPEFGMGRCRSGLEGPAHVCEIEQYACQTEGPKGFYEGRSCDFPGVETMKKRMPWPLIISSVGIFATILISSLAGVHHIDGEIAATETTLNSEITMKTSTLNTQIEQLGTRLTKTEDAVKVLGSQQSDQTQKLIRDLLAAARSAEKPEVAARAIQVVASLAAALAKERRSALPEFFQKATQDVNALRQKREADLKEVTFRTQQQLAEYRSALESSKTVGTVFTCAPGGEFASPDGDRTNPNRPVEGLNIANCDQTLDWFTWKNVVFISSRITYNGGPVILEGVTFVNCKFDVGVNDAGFQLLQYAALEQKDLKIKPEALIGINRAIPAGKASIFSLNIHLTDKFHL